jgi:hypothetical protein
MADTILTARYSRPQFLATNENLGTDASAVIWEGLAIVEVEVSPSAGTTDFPLFIDSPKDSPTTEKIQSDDLQAVKIIQPAKLRLSAIVADLSKLENIISVFKDETVTISVNTKSIITKNLILTELNVSQNADMLSATKVDMTFEQVAQPENSGYSPEQAADGSVYGIGVQQPPSITGNFGSLQKTITVALGRVPVTIFGPLLNNAGGPFILDHLKSGMLA